MNTGIHNKSKVAKIGKVSKETLGYPFHPEVESVGGSIRPRYRQ